MEGRKKKEEKRGRWLIYRSIHASKLGKETKFQYATVATTTTTRKKVSNN